MQATGQLTDQPRTKAFRSPAKQISQPYQTDYQRCKKAGWHDPGSDIERSHPRGYQQRQQKRKCIDEQCKPGYFRTLQYQSNAGSRWVLFMTLGRRNDLNLLTRFSGQHAHATSAPLRALSASFLHGYIHQQSISGMGHYVTGTFQGITMKGSGRCITLRWLVHDWISLYTGGVYSNSTE